MKTYKTIKGCVNHIIRNMNTGIEKTLNDTLMFGMGVYAYKKDIPSGIGTKTNNNLFVSLSKNEIEIVVSYLLLKDGYLVSC